MKQYGWTAKAKEMRGQIEEANNLILQKRIEESAERNAAREQARLEEFRKPKPIGFNDPYAIRARRDWKLSDDIGLGA